MPNYSRRRMNAGPLRTRLVLILTLALGGLGLGVLPAQAAITPATCLSNGSGIYQEQVLFTYSYFQLKCGRTNSASPAGQSGFGFRHIHYDGHPVPASTTAKFFECLRDAIAYGADQPANSPNRQRYLNVDGTEARVVYLPKPPPQVYSIVTAYTGGSPSNQWSVCASLYGS